MSDSGAVVMEAWQEKKIGDFLVLEYGKPLDKNKRKKDGLYPAYGANGVKCWSDEFYHDQKTIIVGRKGSAGEITLTENKFWPLDVTYFVRLDESKYDLGFIYYLLSKLDLPSLATGVKPGINRNNVYAIDVSVPELPEQKRIVAILDQAFADIDKARANAEQNLKNARELFESYLQQVFSQRGEGWVERKLSTFCEKITVGHVGSMASRYKDKGITFLRSQNIREFHISLDGVKFIDNEFNDQLKKSQLIPGHVAIVRTGYPGTAAVIPETLPISNCSDIVIVKTKSELCPHFLTLFLNSNYGKSLVASNLVGAAQKHFNVTAAKNVLFPAPSVLIQDEMVASADSVRLKVKELEVIYNRKLDSLEELKKSILQKAFTGELTRADAKSKNRAESKGAAA